MDYCYNKNRPFPRLLIIDSPLCTKYDKIEKDESERLKLGTIDAFASNCNSKEWNYQFIAIDNKFADQLNYSDLTKINFINLDDTGGLFQK